MHWRIPDRNRVPKHRMRSILWSPVVNHRAVDTDRRRVVASSFSRRGHNDRIGRTAHSVSYRNCCDCNDRIEKRKDQPVPLVVAVELVADCNDRSGYRKVDNVDPDYRSRCHAHNFDRISDHTWDHILDHTWDRTLDRILDRISDRTWGRILDRISDRTSGRILDRIWDRNACRS